MKQLVLFVNGKHPRSVAAYKNLQAACERHTPGEYAIELVDVRQRREVACEKDLVALPRCLVICRHRCARSSVTLPIWT
ncbi:hypothetical protein KX729_27040 [Rhizobium sp. XQZ8]|uniref:circadian clock KaiB family protein n=1 Tax=Rhizobium populisoli TaxID=2859785 RepID=UPI001CA51F9B|nr:circadian clock KaiB family protein [Rhizobium populisoli]MBW6425105.1 hypothetical protein [Rhizobium populisoli]